MRKARLERLRFGFGWRRIDLQSSCNKERNSIWKETSAGNDDDDDDDGTDDDDDDDGETDDDGRNAVKCGGWICFVVGEKRNTASSSFGKWAAVVAQR